MTMKDSVRDSYLVALTILKEKKLLSEEFQKAMETTHCLTDELNDTSEQTVTKVQTILEKMRKNSYSLETDSGKADMVTGKVVLNMQWSGDGVYTMDEAEKDGLELSYAVPEEGSNLWFDGFCMMKNGISGDAKKKQAAQAFINYISRPDNVIRNMYYVGYTSVIAGGDMAQRRMKRKYPLMTYLIFSPVLKRPKISMYWRCQSRRSHGRSVPSIRSKAF